MAGAEAGAEIMDKGEAKKEREPKINDFGFATLTKKRLGSATLVNRSQKHDDVVAQTYLFTRRQSSRFLILFRHFRSKDLLLGTRTVQNSDH